MTKEEEKEIIRVCGKDYDEWNIPAYIRQRDKKKELAKANSQSNNAQLDKIAEEEREKQEYEYTQCEEKN